jgi:hypothetical protein
VTRAGPRAAALAAAVALSVGACSGSTDVRTQEKRAPAPSTTTTTVPVPTAPFTGLPDPDGVANSRQSVAVKIENSPESRPQSGLDVADIVYEEVVEGGVTRFWAVFNSQAPENIGPVRSVRRMDPNIVKPLGGVIAYSGGTQPNVDLIRATGLVWVDENNAGEAFFREPERSAPHDLYARRDQLLLRGGQPVPPQKMFGYVPEGQQFVGEPVAQLHVNFDPGYDVTYVWDPSKLGWLRSQGGEPFLAVGSSYLPAQVAPTNVIIQFIPYPAGSDGNVMGTGEAWIFSNGQLVRGTWERPIPEWPTSFWDAAHQPVGLTPGTTWVELVPIGRAIDIVPGTATTTTTSTTKPKGRNQAG